jgi:PAS domain S-box-containing protein
MDALIVLGQSQYDLILLDQKLPDMPGLELMQAMAREGITVPALMVTAHGDEHLATQVLHAGALDYIVKDTALTFLSELPRKAVESVTRHRLHHMNQLLLQALESGRDGAMITDLQGTILHVNHALEQMSGYNRSELIGANPRLLRSSVNPPELYRSLWLSILARVSWQGELTNRRKDGSLLEVSLTVAPIVNSSGQLTHFVGIQRDITERRHLERQLFQAQKMQSVGTLAGGVAHEFNNLLAGINGYASLALREPGLNANLNEFLNNIVHLSGRAAGLTRQLLAFARKAALSRRTTLIADLLRGTTELVTQTLHVELESQIDDRSAEGLQLMVEGDSNQLQQALVNLVLNARDANSAEPRPIQIRAFQQLLTSVLPAFPNNVPPGDYVVLEVADRGCGMSSEVLNQALDPFFTTKEVGQGTGLGLPVVFGIVQAHQGWLTIESVPGTGTTVRLHLPRLRLLPQQAQPSESFESGQVLEPEASEGHAILVVDDEEAVRNVIRRFLEIAGHRVTCAASGSEAIELLRHNQQFEVIVLDMIMPREDAVVTMQTLQERWPQVPVLLCTGAIPHEAGSPNIPPGAAGLLRKPFRMNELWYAVKQAIEGSTM